MSACIMASHFSLSSYGRQPRSRLPELELQQTELRLQRKPRLYPSFKRLSNYQIHHSESSTIDKSHSPLDFPESDTPMAPPSDSEGVTAPRTRSRKRTVSEVSKSETSDVPVVNKPVKKKMGLKPKPKCVPKKSVASRKIPGPTPSPMALWSSSFGYI
ncbi:hypothetical protein DFH08DRAFT_1045452 [Mycena albidolilacea]|uniref:Uncharacterized protein n=1 Tax=Mycena albidolilacea TaxID=1033008 RepID=A0AAD7ECE6_9AGAR|nr:hypothetical protein DFH08DRAFT_1045452 [Mycena albidolilacea]